MIKELLFSHDCVIVPGFGGFICNYKPSVIDRQTGVFNPPAREVSFNRNLTRNDGLLIQRICSAGVTYGDARTIVENFVAGVTRQLVKNGSFAFDRIGVFTRNIEGGLEFEPDRSVNFHLEAFGLEPFQCFPIDKYDVRKRIITPGPLRNYNFRKYIWRAAVLLPVAAVIIAVSARVNLFRPGIGEATLNPLVAAELEHNRAAVDSNINEIIINPADTTTTAADVVPGTVKDVPEISNVPGQAEDSNAAPETAKPQLAANAEIAKVRHYYIITGSFQSEENAAGQVKLLQAEGFNPEVVYGSNGFYRVCAMACPDLETAIARKDSIDRKFPGSWISRKK